MDSQTKALIRKYLTGAAVAALGGAVTSLAAALGAGTTPDPKTLALAMLAGAVGALRLWYMRQTSSLASIFGLEKSLGDKLAASPADGPDEGGILYRVMLPSLEPPSLEVTAVLGLTGSPVPTAAPTMVEVRKFSDPRLQEAVEHAFQASGGRNGAFFNVNLNGEVRSGVAIKVGGHLSFSGFLIKKPGVKMEGLAEVAFAF